MFAGIRSIHYLKKILPILQYKELDNPFTLNELNIAVSNMNLKSASSLDQIDYSVIASLPSEYTYLLSQIYNSILAEGSFPSQRKQSLV